MDLSRQNNITTSTNTSRVKYNITVARLFDKSVGGFDVRLRLRFNGVRERNRTFSPIIIYYKIKIFYTAISAFSLGWCR